MEIRPVIFTLVVAKTVYSSNNSRAVRCATAANVSDDV